MLPILSIEKLVETKTCRHCAEKFPITDKDLEFYEKVSPTFGGKKYLIPTPTLCPDCRQQRRLSFRNERKLYKRTCDLSGKEIISIYSPDKPHKVYDQKEWWSDKWDPMSYGRDFDFKRDFFEQFQELIHEVPHYSIMNTGSEDCDYSQVTQSKKCYYSFVGGSNEDVYYSHWMVNTIDCVDCLQGLKIENCYDCVVCNENSVGLFSCFNASMSKNSSFCWNIKNCSDCFMSGNIINKRYVFKNKQLDALTYSEAVKNYRKNKNYHQIRDERNALMKWSFFKSNNNLMSETCTGNDMINSNDSKNCFWVMNASDCKYMFDSSFGSYADIMDAGFWKNASLSYESLSYEGNHILFSLYALPNSTNLFYCYFSSSSSDLFACVGLRNKQYCIFNRQYTKEQYEELVPKIIEHMKKTGEWGEFFPSSLSPFGYNETVASEYFPLTKAEATKKGFNWSDYEAPFPKVDKVIPASKLPEDITKIPDDILNWAIECEVTKKPFRIIKQELEFYRKHNLPIPRRHPDQRHLDRMALRNPRTLFERKCDKCKTDMLTTYAPERPEMVYCEVCYNKEVIG